ncbi:MAG: HypC/HybG/HupF family hydrogenase formation chaperone [Candidatus Omnitrophica bacterium]|jgi:biotin synthase|nr:HypC/HybG/HupF family hydrogenase formation chaperone [Candidatus Omnitrophota bacterium]
MCYAIPGKVKEIQDKKVIVDYFGEEKKALNEFYDLKVGDYICAQGGYVIKKVSPQEAESILSAWSELFFDLQSIDLRLSRLDFQDQKVDKKLRLILDRALEKGQLSKEELLYLFNLTNVNDINLLFRVANFLRHKFHKNSCCVHGIIEISNSCQRLCAYCGISAHNKNIQRYRMSAEEIINIAVEAVKKYGFQALILQSAEDPGYSVNDLADIIEKIKEQVEVLIGISFGEVGLEGLGELYQAGARAILLRFETSNPQIYQRLHPGRTLDSRLNHIKKAYQIGYLVMTGALIGLPGQNDEDIINDLYLTKALGAEMYSFGPFLPHPDTPLKSSLAPYEEKVLKTLALARIIDPENAKILVTTAFETLSNKAREKGLVCGANSVMLNITPLKYRKLYSIYPNKAYSATLIDKQIEETIALLKSLGRAPTDLGITQNTK